MADSWPRHAAVRGSREFLYPFLFSLYPVFFLYLRNIREVTVGQALWAAGVSLGIAITGWFLTRICCAAPDKRALLLFLFLLLFHFYGLYYALIAGWLLELPPPAAHALAFTLPGGAWLLLSLRIVRSRRSFSVSGRILNVVVISLLAWSLAGIIMFHVAPPAGKERPWRTAPTVRPERTPDIYCFILDEFMAPEEAQRVFGHDADGFVASLRRQDFIVAAGSMARFSLTEPAIADILNLGNFSAATDPFPRVRRNAVAAFLKERNYRIVEFACLPPLFMVAADQRFYYDLSHVSVFFNDFYRVLFERSLLRILPELWSQRRTDLSHFYRQRVLQVFADLPGVVREPGPKFVFVHLSSPHEPFVFDARGGPADPKHIWDHRDPRYYLQQYDFIGRRIAETTAMIIRDSPTPPILLIQSDHGYRGSRRPGNESRPVAHADMLRVFNALYLPGVPAGAVDPSLPPRNNFRLVFNEYFGARYPLLRRP